MSDSKEISDDDILELIQEPVVVNAETKGAKQEWAHLFAREVNTLELFGVGTLFADRHKKYYGAD